jgi:hypothetical protein
VLCSCYTHKDTHTHTHTLTHNHTLTHTLTTPSKQLGGSGGGDANDDASPFNATTESSQQAALTSDFLSDLLFLLTQSPTLNTTKPNTIIDDVGNNFDAWLDSNSSSVKNTLLSRFSASWADLAGVNFDWGGFLATLGTLEVCWCVDVVLWRCGVV